ncbi:MAG: RNA polymerase sigma factor [Planctomycetota bacterium]
MHQGTGGPLGDVRQAAGTRREAQSLEAHRTRLVRCAQRVLTDPGEAEDVAQETLERGLDAELREERALGAWLLATCTRLAIDRLRRRQRRERALARAPQPRPAPDPGAVVLTRAEARRARAALDRLQDPYRAAMRLRYLEQLEVPEIAVELDANPHTVRTWLGRGLVKLRAELGVR